MRRLLVTANVPTLRILVTLMMEALRSSETSVLTRATRRNIPEGGTLDTGFFHVRAKLLYMVRSCSLPYFVLSKQYTETVQGRGSSGDCGVGSGERGAGSGERGATGLVSMATCSRVLQTVETLTVANLPQRPGGTEVVLNGCHGDTAGAGAGRLQLKNETLLNSCRAICMQHLRLLSGKEDKQFEFLPSSLSAGVHRYRRLLTGPHS
jgi:hypothetical protein